MATRQPRKVLHVLNSSGGGAALSTLALINSLKEQGVSSCIVCHDAGSRAERQALLDAADKQVLFTPLYWWNKKIRSAWWKRPLVELRQLYRTGWRKKSTSLVTAFARQHAVEMIHSNTILTLEGALAAHQTSIPHVWHIRELVGPGKPFRFNNEGPAFGTFLARYASKVIANSEATASLIRDWLPPDLLEVVPNGIDIRRFPPSKESVLKRKIVVAMVGNLTARWKKHEQVVEAAACVDRSLPIEWRFYGVDPSQGGTVRKDEYLNHLHDRIAELGLTDHFRFPGFVQDPVQIMSEIDILIHPADHESFGRVVVEAMAASLPVVGVHGGGVGEIVVDGKTGFLAQPDNVVQLADSVRKLVCNAELRRAFGINGRQRALEMYSVDAMVRGVIRIYEQVLSGSVSTNVHAQV